MTINKIFRLFAIATLVVGAWACESFDDYLEKAPDDDMTKDEVFTNPEWARSWLWNCYSWLPSEANFADDGAWRSPFTGGSDEMEIAFGASYAHLINAGSWNATNITRVPVWAETYCSLRSINTFIENIDRVPNMEQTEKDELTGEAYFLRAFMHFLSLRCYGPIPIIDYVVATDDDWSAIVRKPFDECVTAIVNDCMTAISKLPRTRPKTEYGRPIKSAAYALRSRVLLYAASPLYNGNTELARLKDTDTGNCLISQTYDPNKWKLAAVAAQEALEEFELAKLQLHYSDSQEIGRAHV